MVSEPWPVLLLLFIHLFHPLVPTSKSIILLNLPIATKLNRTNFLVWQSQIVPLLHGYDLFKFVDYLSPSPPNPTITSDNTIVLNPAYLT
jgi:hypothetical protein